MQPEEPEHPRGRRLQAVVGPAEYRPHVAGDLLLGDLFGRLSADAQDLLIGASVYRSPVGHDVLLLPGRQYSRAAGLAGLVAECAATGLLAADPGCEPPSVFVHRWTACELHRRLAEAKRGGVHRRSKIGRA